jgi:hypothetical protein
MGINGDSSSTGCLVAEYVGVPVQQDFNQVHAEGGDMGFSGTFLQSFLRGHRYQAREIHTMKETAERNSGGLSARAEEVGNGYSSEDQIDAGWRRFTGATGSVPTIL